MAKEIEVKVLDVDVKKLEERLSILGAEKISDNIQKILTYDFRSIASEYRSILYDLNGKVSEKIITHALKRLKTLFFDLDDLINEKDTNGIQKSMIKQIFGQQSLSVFLEDNGQNWSEHIEKLNDERFLGIVEKYGINPNKWIRLRQTGNRTAVTIKHILNRKTDENGVREHSINDVLEYEILIDNFDKGKEVLELLGYHHKNYQEKRRITYRLDGMEIDIDFWPHIPAYIEIEGDTESEVYAMMGKLGYGKEEAKIMNADDVYTSYGINMYSYKELKFDA